MLIKLEKFEKKMETVNRFAYKTTYIWAKKDSKRLISGQRKILKDQEYAWVILYRLTL